MPATFSQAVLACGGNLAVTVQYPPQLALVHLLVFLAHAGKVNYPEQLVKAFYVLVIKCQCKDNGRCGRVPENVPRSYGVSPDTPYIRGMSTVIAGE